MISLAADTAHSVMDDAGRSWPAVDGIPFLRHGREELAAEALAELDRVDAISGASDATRTLRAACLSRVGGYAEALALYRDLLTRRPGEPRLLLSVGHLEKTLGDEAAAQAHDAGPELGGEPGIGTEVGGRHVVSITHYLC